LLIRDSLHLFPLFFNLLFLILLYEIYLLKNNKWVPSFSLFHFSAAFYTFPLIPARFSSIFVILFLSALILMIYNGAKLKVFFISAIFSSSFKLCFTSEILFSFYSCSDLLGKERNNQIKAHILKRFILKKMIIIS